MWRSKITTRDYRSPEAHAYRHLYKDRRWRHPTHGLRARQLAAHPICKFCEDQRRITPATVADHIKDHKGDPRLFFDPANLQSLCKPCHDGPKQREGRTGYSTAIGVDGWPVAADHPANRA